MALLEINKNVNIYMHIHMLIATFIFCSIAKGWNERLSGQRTMVAEDMEISNRQNLVRWIADGWISAWSISILQWIFV